MNLPKELFNGLFLPQEWNSAPCTPWRVGRCEYQRANSTTTAGRGQDLRSSELQRQQFKERHSDPSIDHISQLGGGADNRNGLSRSDILRRQQVLYIRLG